jgi:hypothetical protein
MRAWQMGMASVGSAVLLFGAMILLQELGWRIGKRKRAARGDETNGGNALLDTAVFGLLGLLLGFTFSSAAGRFDHRRELVGRVVNASGTAWQRIDLLPPQSQDSVRAPFRRYLDALLASYTATNVEPVDYYREPPAAGQAAAETWSRAVKACLTPEGEQARMLLLPALNDMFGAVENERLARRIHPPFVVFGTLGLTALAAALLAGIAAATAARRDWVHRIGVAATIALAVYVIVELEYPRLGLVQVDSMDQALGQLRATLK